MATYSSDDSSLPSRRLLGKVALVTGGASGIGESIVRLFHQHGAKVCIVDIQDDLGQQLSATLGVGDDQGVCYFHCDVSVEDDVSRAVDFTVERFGSLDILVNNAGISGGSGPDIRNGISGGSCPDIRNAELSMFNHVFDVNVKGVFLGMKHAARVMIPQKKGSIISFSSIAGIVGGIMAHSYTASKHAVVGLTRNVAAELGNHHIRVNCVSPYAVATNMVFERIPEDERTEEAKKGLLAFYAEQSNLRGLVLTADYVANTVLFLASDEARYISGSNLVVDGGFSSVNHALRVFR